MALERRTSRLFGSRISAIFSSNDHPHLESRDSPTHSTPLAQTASRAAAQPLSRAPLVNSGRSAPQHKTDLPTPSQSEIAPNAPHMPVKSVRGQAEYSNMIALPESPSPLVARPPTSNSRLHRKPPPPLDLPLETVVSPFKQLLQIPAESSEFNPESLRNIRNGLTDIIDSLEEEIGNMMGTPEHTETFSLSDKLRLVSVEPTGPLNLRTMAYHNASGAYKNNESDDLPQDTSRSRVPSQKSRQGIVLHTAEDLPDEQANTLPEPLPPSSDELSFLFSPSKDIIQAPLLPAYDLGRRGTLADNDIVDTTSPVSGPEFTNPELYIPLKSSVAPESSEIIDFDPEENEYSLSDDSASMHTLEQQLSGSQEAHSYSTNDNSVATSRESLVVLSQRPMQPMQSQDSRAASDSLSDLPFFAAERFVSSNNASKSNLDLIVEDAQVAESTNQDNSYFLNTAAMGPTVGGASMNQGLPASPGYPVSEMTDSFLSYTFGQTSLSNPRSPLKPTLTFMSTDSGVSRTWSNSALLKNFHARMLLTSSITSNSSNRHVNLATLKRSFSLRPGEGERSTYVQTIRRNAGTSYNDTGPGKWKLPTGIMPVDKKSLYLQTSNKFNRGGSGARTKKASGVGLKHGHLQPRMLAAEVGDNDDSGKFGSLGRSSTVNTVVNTLTAPSPIQKVISPVTSKSSNPSVLGGISRESSLNRSKSLASGSTNNDLQSVQTKDSKLSGTESEVSSMNSDGSISEYKFGDGYYQHPGYKYDDVLEAGSHSPSTEDYTMHPSYDDIDDIDEDSEEEEKPRLFLANPDLSSEED